MALLDSIAIFPIVRDKNVKFFLFLKKLNYFYRVFLEKTSRVWKPGQGTNLFKMNIQFPGKNGGATNGPA